MRIFIISTYIFNYNLLFVKVRGDKDLVYLITNKPYYELSYKSRGPYDRF